MAPRWPSRTRWPLSGTSRKLLVFAQSQTQGSPEPPGNSGRFSLLTIVDLLLNIESKKGRLRSDVKDELIGAYLLACALWNWNEVPDHSLLVTVSEEDAEICKPSTMHSWRSFAWTTSWKRRGVSLTWGKRGSLSSASTAVCALKRSRQRLEKKRGTPDLCGCGPTRPHDI